MKCKYLLFNGLCGAHPPNIQQESRPDSLTKANFCEHYSEMSSCPRLHQYLDYLEASQAKKKTKEKSVQQQKTN